MDRDYLDAVRAQYEQFPYPPREPAEERERLLEMLIDRLAVINHYCFRGACDFEGARVLVAGGGTGDSTIYLAEQLHERNAEVVYADISGASMRIAQQRAAIRNLRNIHWRHESVLSLTPENAGFFDYISCTGVLHHLADPALGLRRLKALLKPGGAIGVMIYGKYGRSGVYQMQKLMRLINEDETDLAAKVRTTRQVLAQLPPTNWFRHNESFLSDHKNLGDSGVVDLLLHEQDVAYSIDEVHQLLADVGLNFVEFTDPRMRLAYRPETYIRDPALLDKIRKLDRVKRQAISELMVGLFMKHEFYVSQQPDCQAKFGSLSHVPFFLPERSYRTLGQQISTAMLQRPNQLIPLRHESGLDFSLRANPISAAIFAQIDGVRPWGQIFENTRAHSNGLQSSDAELFEFFRPTFEQFAEYDWMLLREESARGFLDTIELQAKSRGRGPSTALAAE
ncbi:MAG TPA: class I SAM-dependent methyltransferase [Candidatus Binatia bacterium]|nr:class I SAM-dependent methyltransferase [Candidatus Binatia bacterium]